MISKKFTAAVLWGFSATMSAQPTKTPTLEEILQRLEANLNHYDARLPSLFCDEQVISNVEPGQRQQDIITDSVFRLKRSTNADHTTTLVESREIKNVNGKAPTSRDLKGPSLLSGVFEGALAIISSNQTTCMNYALQRINRHRATEPYIIRFATVLTPDNSSDCLLQENSKGRAFIDPASMQITRLELTTPHHTIIPADRYSSSVIGKRVLTVDYAPVVLDGEAFWMPSTIASRETSDPGTFHMTVWSFQATYRNYHKLKVTSRILPGNEAPAP